MPLYNYWCRCGHTGELSVPIAKRDDLQPCPFCGENTYMRSFSPSVTRNHWFQCAVYENTDGKHAWKKGKSEEEIAQILLDDKSPF